MQFGRVQAVDLKSDVRSGTFTGDVWGDGVVAANESVTVNHVHFAPGARTFWHRHAAGQLLIATAGSGHIANRAGERRDLAEGDAVWIEPGEEHWHGASGRRELSHLAISLGEAEWLEAATDEEYGGR